ncbi:MAG TPA: CoA transferase, partial [Steroidobacteraceae bacterium]|nr:CoA transferase [Steroidobacteraceae bacterium]
LGAEVLKIERPQSGDDFRDFARLPGWEVSPSFIAVNAGKRSITVNLKAAEGREIIRRLVATADVLVENQRPNLLESLGLGWRELRQIKPDLIYCSLSGFGQTGEMHSWPAYDHTVQAMSGMGWTGADDDIPSQGRGFSIDCFSGYVAFSSILSALFRRERSGEGQFLDVAMLDSAMVLMAVGLVRQMLTGDRIKATQPIVHDRPTVGAFRTADGWIWISGNFQNHFLALCRVLGRSELAQDPRFSSSEARQQHADELKAELAGLIATRQAEELEIELMRAGAPAARVRTTQQALQIASLAERGMLQATQTPDGRPVTVFNSGFVADADSPALSGPVPRIGAHTHELLAELGFDAGAIGAMKQKGII